ncbi:MAG: ROK family protein [Chloroflexi bacterium]|nr:ROK family protein [Chloroflexota bacterium]MDL1884980.1 ROK family protein [Anaerolineae bacterium CFX8]
MGILAIDFGGTRTRTAWYDANLEQQARNETPSLVNQPAESVIQRIIETARRVVPPGAVIEAVGISAPGPLDSRAGVIRHAKTLPGWVDVPLAAIVGEAFGAPAWMENDANLAALSEYRLGAGRGCDPMVYLTISTGIGGGAVIGGRLFTGWSGLAVEPGHMRFTLPDGSVRRLEELASGTAVGQRAQERLARDAAPSSLRDAPEINGQIVGQAAQAGDPLALEVVREAGFWLGLGIVNLLHLLSPQAIVVGGSVSLLGDLLFDPARAAIKAHVLDPAFIPPALIRPAALGDDVCLVGAAAFALQTL